MIDSAKAASLLALGCGTSNAALDAGDALDARSHEPDPQPDGSAPPHDDGSVAVQCPTTRADIEGPFFKPSSPERVNLLEASLPGVVLTLRGRVLDASCSPVVGAVIDFWQADDDGAYDNAGSRLRGHQVVGGDGSYELTTIVPGRYLNGSQYRPAHLHCKVYVGGVERLTTQLYFEGDPFNEVDPWFSEQTMLRTRPTGDGGDALDADFDFSVIV